MAAAALMLAPVSAAAQLQPHTLTYAPGKTITLALPSGFEMDIAARGLRRVRFFAQSPDGRIFATAMRSLADNSLGSIFILEGWNAQTRSFGRITRYLDHLRNPNSIAFWTDASGKSWIYVALTDKVVRYEYRAGEAAPAGAPQTIIRFPDYGLNYKYGGWHLTRTIAVGRAGGKPRIFVSVGSSCNYCREREAARASILSMDPDGANPKLIARGIRNAVDLHYLPEIEGGTLFATNMGADHLGDGLPDDTFFKVNPQPDQTVNFGWPGCYLAQGKVRHDSTPLPSLDRLLAESTGQPAQNDSVYGKQRGVAAAGTNLAAGGGHAATTDPNADLGPPAKPLTSCESVPPAYAWFPAHSSPLGFALFPESDARLRGSFLVALHGAGHPHIGSGYRVVQFTVGDRRPVDFITGFLRQVHGKGVVHGRPCGIFRVGPDSFLLTDDYLGLVYFVHPNGTAEISR